MNERRALEPGSRLGAYEIVSMLGAGGMGVVYRAHDPRLGRDVAIKVLAPALTGNVEWLARFEREARTVAALNHPNIVTIHSVEEDHGIRFLTMELIDGESLDQAVQSHRIDLNMALEIASSMADALVSAHSRGVIHRDLKPGNVMVTADGRVKVLDFGLAIPLTESAGHEQTKTAPTPVTSPEQVMGTVPYMSPEQLRGARLDARSDLFAFGVVLHELVSGQRPFVGETAADVTSAILRDAPAALRVSGRVLPPDLLRLVARCLEKDPERRLQTAKDVRNELELIRRAAAVAANVAPGSGGRRAEGADGTSIAVLPFVNRSPHPDDEYFSDGITEDVIAQLCKVRSLRVTSRSSVMPFRDSGESLKDIAAKLQVRNVLEGSVRRAGDRVRIVAQSSDAESGPHLWA